MPKIVRGAAICFWLPQIIVSSESEDRMKKTGIVPDSVNPLIELMITAPCGELEAHEWHGSVHGRMKLISRRHIPKEK